MAITGLRGINLVCQDLVQESLEVAKAANKAKNSNTD